MPDFLSQNVFASSNTPIRGNPCSSFDKCQATVG